MNQPIVLHKIVPTELTEHRLDIILAQLFPEFSRSILQQWIKKGYVRVNQHAITQPKTKMKGGEIIEINAEITEVLEPQPEDIPLTIVYEDESILVINKPAGLTVHPGAGQAEHTLQNALLYHAPHLAKLQRAGIVHRLDKQTSGLLVVAKTLQARTSLVRQLQKRKIKRQYEAIVIGQIIAGGTVDAPIDRHPNHRTHMAVVETGKPAVTHYRIKERFKAHTALTVTLETGRTHQIRVHMAYIHHPILGDPVYGGNRQSLFKRQALHAEKLGLVHPVTKEWVEWEAELPEDMQKLKEILKKT